MTVLLIGRDGSSVDPVRLPDGATVADLIAHVAPDLDPADFAAAVNGRPAGPDRALRPGDRVALTPKAPADPAG